MGQYEQALPLFQQALEIIGKSLGTDHPDYAASLNNLAISYTATNHPEEALNLMQEAAEIDLKTISKIFSISTDKQRLNYLAQNYYKVEAFLSLVFRHFPNSPEAVQSAYNLILKTPILPPNSNNGNKSDNNSPNAVLIYPPPNNSPTTTKKLNPSNNKQEPSNENWISPNLT